MISASWVRRKLTLRAVITNVALTGPVDGMNRPTEVTTSTPTAFWMHPEASSEINDSRQVGTTVMVAYFPAHAVLSTTSRITYAGVEFEVITPPQEWIHPTEGRVAWTAKIARTV